MFKLSGKTLIKLDHTFFHSYIFICWVSVETIPTRIIEVIQLLAYLHPLHKLSSETLWKWKMKPRIKDMKCNIERMNQIQYESN